MATDSMGAYQEALRKFEGQTATITRLVSTVISASEMLKSDWKRVRFSNVGDIRNPLGTDRSINGQEWPSAQQLAQELADWHHAHHEMYNAWKAIPRGQRDIIQPPSD